MAQHLPRLHAALRATGTQAGVLVAAIRATDDAHDALG